MKVVLLAMSGGVDSSVSAHLLRESGYRVLGITLNMGRNCDEKFIVDAKAVAKILAIEHQVLDVSRDFRKNVVDYFIDSYCSGETPNPCARCNRSIKFSKLFEFKEQIGADFVATGHYAQIFYGKDGYELHRAPDGIRDQSYFLSTIDSGYLQYLKFPIGSLKKNQVRSIARAKKLPVADKSDSQDICFIEGDYRNFLCEQLEYSKTTKKSSLPNRIGITPGEIRHVNGKLLGKHRGLFGYTLGQRRGLGIATGEPIFVTKIDVENNILWVGTNADLLSSEVLIHAMNLFAEIENDGDNKKYMIKLRSTHRGQCGTVQYDKITNSARVKLDEPARAVTPGQLCCIYDNDRVVASGWIGGIRE